MHLAGLDIFSVEHVEWFFRDKCSFFKLKVVAPRHWVLGEVVQFHVAVISTNSHITFNTSNINKSSLPQNKLFAYFQQLPALLHKQAELRVVVQLQLGVLPASSTQAVRYTLRKKVSFPYWRLFCLALQSETSLLLKGQPLFLCGSVQFFTFC